MTKEKKLLWSAYADIDYLLKEGFDTNHVECKMDGVRETLNEIREELEAEPMFSCYLKEYEEVEEVK